MTRKDDTKLLIAVFQQWGSSRLDINLLSADLNITPSAANMRLTRLNQRLNTNGTPTNAELELLIAIINQERRLPNINYHRLGRDLDISFGAAAMRWLRLKARLEALRKRVQVSVKKTVEEEEEEEKNGVVILPVVKEKEKELVENSTAASEIEIEIDGGVGERERGVFGWPYNEMGWSDDE